MLNLDQKLYQLIISRLDGDKLPSKSYQEHVLGLVEKGIGGFILFGGEKDELKGFIEKLQSISDIPLFISSDIERGAGQQASGATWFPSQMAVSAAIDKTLRKDQHLLEKMILAIAAEAIDIGINMPLIPVMDVNREPDNPIICTRAFSDNPATVAWYGKKYIRTLEDQGLLSCAKHFPGHGDTAIDSHISLPVISKSIKDLMDIDVYPFREAIAEGVSSIMIGHLSIPEIDPLPASLSKKVITDLLRQGLGFGGLIMTDALNMHSLNKFGSVPEKCVNAGVDIILHPADSDAVVDDLKRSVSEGRTGEATIDSAVERILRFKSEIQNINKPEVNYSIHRELSAEISVRSVTCVKDTPDALPTKNLQNVSLFVSGDEHEFDMTPLKELSPEGDRVVNVKGLDLEKVSIKETVIISLFTNIAAWKGSSGIPDEEMNTIREIIRTSAQTIVVSFGSPYVLRHLMEADVLIAAYDSTEQAQRAVVKCLEGENNFNGKLPVHISP
ncbi:MAG: glycoside hydrolase family 3 N-terminal domain-containing protein [Nitrospirota bacterium]